MSTAELAMSEANGFGASREQFATVLAFLDGAEAAALSHAELETRVQVDSRELFRLLFQDHLDLRASREQRVTVLGPDGVSRSRAETAHTRVLVTVFGQVTVTRIDMGVDPKTLSDRIGHANMSVTLQIYGHRSHGRDQAMAQNLGELIQAATEVGDAKAARLVTDLVTGGTSAAEIGLSDPPESASEEGEV